MTDPAPPPPATKGVLAWDDKSGGVEWHLELDRSILLPATLLTGRLRIRADSPIEARGLLIGLTATEHWRHRETRTDGSGHTTTVVVTDRADVEHEPVQLRGPLSLAAGETLEVEFEQPVPPDGPATLLAEDAGLDWTIEAKLDVADGLDSRIERGVVVAQPTALIRAGGVAVGEFALYDTADAVSGSITATIQLSPAPLVCGAPFTGHVEVKGDVGKIRGVRAEVRVHVEATVAQGENESLTLWSGELTGDGTYAIAGTLPSTPVPSVELPHGRTEATFHVILDRPLAVDTHLVRDIAIATTAEV